MAAAVSARPQHGSLAEETARLFEALQQAAGGWNRGSPHDGPEVHDHAATPSSCRVCPLCQVIAAVQNVRPETVQHLADAAASLAAAVADLVGSAATDPRRQDRRDEPAPREDVQHIDITD